ncbi:unnamed protein product [Brachionus calyciflorus]|uniref:Uncharacterized protein n=1 Tax=Brachionus calyciflorus TaxID=104777 RepID=A0A813PTA5_9BILA|nr:unnamed protein product [Brachionus calyciflorus]
MSDASKNKRKITENDMVLIEFDDNSRDIVNITELNNGNYHNINIGKKYGFKFDNKWNLVRVKFIGTSEQCHQEFEKISEMAETEHSKVSQSDLSMDSDKNSNTQNTSNIDYYTERIKELEAALIQRDLRILLLEKQLKEQEDINHALKNTFCEKDITLLRDLSINFLKVFGNGEVHVKTEVKLPVVQEAIDTNFLSEKYPEITLPSDIKNKVQTYLTNPNETASSAFRKVITALIPDAEEWATSNRILLVEKFKNEVHASYEYVKKFKPNFDYNVAEGELRKIASERRRDLKKLGYVFETYKDLNETFCRYRIVSKPYVEIDQKSNDQIPNTSQSFMDNNNEYYDETYNEELCYDDPYRDEAKRQKLSDSGSED